MGRPNKRTRDSETLTLHLGKEGRDHLERALQLLSQRSPAGDAPSRGGVVRTALRRLLLALLGERAIVADLADPYYAEYLAVLDVEPRFQESGGSK